MGRRNADSCHLILLAWRPAVAVVDCLLQPTQAHLGSGSAYNSSLLSSSFQVVNVLTSVIKLEPPDHVSLAVLDFISSLGKLYISQTIRVIHSFNKNTKWKSKISAMNREILGF